LSGWSVTLTAKREDVPAELDSRRVSNGGNMPDFVCNLIAAEVATLAPGLKNAKIVTSGCLGQGSPRVCKFSVEGSA
jgi:hypothetical protein